MPHSASAAKRVRQSEKNRIRNKSRRTEIKTLIKKIQRAVHDGEKAVAEEALRLFTKRIDQAAAINVVHKNTASRYKSRLASKVHQRFATAPAQA